MPALVMRPTVWQPRAARRARTMRGAGFEHHINTVAELAKAAGARKCATLIARARAGLDTIA
jgi:hypothetical protein